MCIRDSNQGTITLERREWLAPASLSYGAETLIPLRAAQSIAWSLRS